jgi:murein L,D-transpeptidase YcbB/YkuD
MAGLALVVAGPVPLAAAQDYTATMASVPPEAAVAGKLATRTEIVADLGETAMITEDSAETLRHAIAMYEEIVAGGGWPTIDAKNLKKGAKGPGVMDLRQRLVRENYLPFESLFEGTPEVFDDTMLQAIRAFQTNHGIVPDGMVGSRTLAELNITAEARLFTLRENLPRVEAFMKDLGHRYILVNIPSAQLETVEDGKVYSRHNVVAGKLDRPSPALASRVSDVTFNPYWKAPASIVERDIIPHYLKDPNYLNEMGIRVFDGVGGPEIDPATVDWSNTPADRYFFRQDPGDNNALATVKINFPNQYMVYMHDTPHRELFGRNARFESSGCVRVDQVKTVIDWILRGQTDYNPSDFDSIVASGNSFDLKVTDPPDVRFMYLTAWATTDGAVNFRPDIYGLDGTGFVMGQPQPRSF